MPLAISTEMTPINSVAGEKILTADSALPPTKLPTTRPSTDISKSVEKDSDIKWNFTKFLISKDGKTIKRYAPTTEPKDFEKDIEEML